MPQNCSADVQAVIQYVDGALQSGDSAQIEYIENAFGMQIQNPAYFGAACKHLVLGSHCLLFMAS